jgi:hypothetical protein
MLGGATLVFGSMGKASYAMRQLMASLVLFSVGFAVLLLLLVFCFLVLRAAVRIVFWVRMRSPQWNRAISEWIFALRQSGRGIAQQWPRIFTRNEKVFLIEKMPILKVSGMLPEEK